MIYLKVRGGLCNRMRTLDSLFILCKEHKKDLIVFWPTDIALNSKFEWLFLLPKFKEFNYKIINCPPGFPESYLPSFKNSIKNFIRQRNLPSNLKNVVKNVKKIKPELQMSEEFLDNQYNIVIDEIQGDVETMDNIFCQKLEGLTSRLINEERDVYINSCYRLTPTLDNYENFIPVEEIRDKINQTTEKFTNTFGLHIRRSDHLASRKHSTLDKFKMVIDNEISRNLRTSFFLSTDDDKTKEDLILKYGDKIIYNEITSFDRNSPDAVKSAVLDLYCLSRTKKVYGSHHSSFSQVAAKIGGIEVQTVK